MPRKQKGIKKGCTAISNTSFDYFFERKVRIKPQQEPPQREPQPEQPQRPLQPLPLP
jgi:hypothetical protein